MDQNMNMGTPVPPMPEEKKSTGAIISIIVIVLILAAGAYYFLKQVPAPSEMNTLTPAGTEADQTISALTTQGTSTNLTDIQKDLDATNLSGLDAGLGNLSI